MSSTMVGPPLMVMTPGAALVMLTSQPRSPSPAASCQVGYHCRSKKPSLMVTRPARAKAVSPRYMWASQRRSGARVAHCSGVACGEPAGSSVPLASSTMAAMAASTGTACSGVQAMVGTGNLRSLPLGVMRCISTRWRYRFPMMSSSITGGKVPGIIPLPVTILCPSTCSIHKCRPDCFCQNP